MITDIQRYRAHEAHAVNARFECLFGITFKNFFQPFLLGRNEILIDLIKFDDYLTAKYQYEGSMADFIKVKFGIEAYDFLNKLI